MLRPTSSIVSLAHQGSNQSLLQSLVNQRPKSQQQQETKRVQSAKLNKHTVHQSTQKHKHQLVTTSLCSPILKEVPRIELDQSQSTRENQENTTNSAKKSLKKTTLVQKALGITNTNVQPTSTISLSSAKVRQKTVKLTRDSRSQSKKDLIMAITTATPIELPPPPPVTESETPIESSEAFQKINSLINKYKNCSYFETPPILVEQDTNVVATQQQPSINKYVTRISKGNVFPVKVKQQVPARKRMNSPSHSLRKSNVDRVMDAGKRTIAAATKVSVFQQPYPEFQYYLSILKYYHNDKRYEQLIKSAFNNSLKTLTYFKEIYQDHFLQSYHALQFCRDSTVSNEYLKKVVNLPNNKFQKTIVFDLDETLIHCQESNDDPADVVLTINFPTGETVEAGINIRPYCKEMLQLLSQKYEIIVFTASHECYAQKVLNQIDPERKFIHYRFFRESCVVIQDGLHVKDLRIIGNRSLNDMVLVDNASYSFCFQPSNGIPIVPFYDNPLDRELIYLTNYLQELMQSADIPTKNNQHFKNHMYMEDTTIEQLITKL